MFKTFIAGEFILNKKIMVVTSTRAEYGLLKPVIQKIAADSFLQLFLVATGTHIKKNHGQTIDEIKKDGFLIDREIDILKFSNDDLGIAKTIAYTVDVFAELLAEIKPDLVLVLGDRYEIFAVACAAATLGVPLSHISGGDVTIGAKDDFYRHSITKMANLHFPSTKESYNRLIQMGENKDFVFNVGGLGHENITSIPLMDITSLSKSLDFDLSDDFALITYHPETLKNGDVSIDMQNLFKALDEVNLNLIFTKANADAGGDIINNLIDEYCKKNSHRAKAFFSLGLLRYLSAMKYTKVVIGNSSSGVVETPSFKTPCVNIGDRQKGRYIAKNVICCDSKYENILSSIKTAISEEFKAIALNAQNPYDNNVSASREIVLQIKEYLKENKNQTKVFFDK